MPEKRVEEETWNSPTKEDMAEYLSGSTGESLKMDGGDISTIWSQARNECRILNKTRMSVQFQCSTSREELKIIIGIPSHTTI